VPADGSLGQWSCAEKEHVNIEGRDDADAKRFDYGTLPSMGRPKTMGLGATETSALKDQKVYLQAKFNCAS